jgi:predicted PolB exonuclease-like 3'-5' exonuclease
MGIIYIVTDNLRIYQSIFKIGKTQNENLRSLETRYRNTINNPIVLAFIDVGEKYEIIERTLLNLFINQRINHGGKIESEWLQIPYITLVLAIKFVITSINTFCSSSAIQNNNNNFSQIVITVCNILREYFIINEDVGNIKIQDIKILPKFFENRLVNHTQNLTTFEPDIFGSDLLFIPSDKWPLFIKNYYTQFNYPCKSSQISSSLYNPFATTIVPEKSSLWSFFFSPNTTTPVATAAAATVTTINSGTTHSNTTHSAATHSGTDEDIKCINDTFTGDNRIKSSFIHLIKNNDTDLKPYRISFDIYVDYLLSIFQSFENIDYTKINKQFLNNFISYYNNHQNEYSNIQNNKSYTYLIGKTCKHIMISGKNKGKYCNANIKNIQSNKCTKHL